MTQRITLYLTENDQAKLAKIQALQKIYTPGLEAKMTHLVSSCMRIGLDETLRTIAEKTQKQKDRK